LYIDIKTLILVAPYPPHVKPETVLKILNQQVLLLLLFLKKIKKLKNFQHTIINRAFPMLARNGLVIWLNLLQKC